VESGEIEGYESLLDCERVSRFYLDELEEIESVGMNTLKLIAAPEPRAIERGKGLIRQIRQEFTDPRLSQELLELIETILVYKLPKINRREIEAMFSLSDLKETRVYQEALEEGREEGREEAKLASVPRLSALGLSAEQIAQALELEIERVRQALSAENEP
jgi:predicted transposase/invertase (TIGR01784 family)